MYLCLRVDLDYVPWDTPDAQEFGHGEPAMTLRLLELARQLGLKLHFFASERVLRAFPTASDAILNDGHHLDWLNKHPEDFTRRMAIAEQALQHLGVDLQGFALRQPWPADVSPDVIPSNIKFVSGPSEMQLPGVRFFPVETRAERDALRAGQNMKAWTETVKLNLRESETVRKGVTFVVRPQVLAKIDPRLSAIREIMEFALSLGFPQRTLRELVAESPDLT